MSTKIDQALVSAFIAGNFEIGIAYENLDFDPVDAYAELRVLHNDTTPATLKHSNQTDGVFRVILRYPTDATDIPAKKKADEIFSVFKIGRKFSYEGVRLTVTGNKREPGANEAGHYKLVLTIPYRAFLTR